MNQPFFELPELQNETNNSTKIPYVRNRGVRITNAFGHTTEFASALDASNSLGVTRSCLYNAIKRNSLVKNKFKIEWRC